MTAEACAAECSRTPHQEEGNRCARCGLWEVFAHGAGRLPPRRGKRPRNVRKVRTRARRTRRSPPWMFPCSARQEQKLPEVRTSEQPGPRPRHRWLSSCRRPLAGCRTRAPPSQDVLCEVRTSGRNVVGSHSSPCPAARRAATGVRHLQGPPFGLPDVFPKRKMTGRVTKLYRRQEIFAKCLCKYGKTIIFAAKKDGEIRQTAHSQGW